MQPDEVPKYRKKKSKNKFEVTSYIKVFFTFWKYPHIQILKQRDLFKKRRDAENFVKQLKKGKGTLCKKRIEKGFITGLVNYKINSL